MPVQEKQRTMDACHRCGGLMVPEWTGDAAGWKCVNCGERGDPVILTHRRLNKSREEAGVSRKLGTADGVRIGPEPDLPRRPIENHVANRPAAAFDLSHAEEI